MNKSPQLQILLKGWKTYQNKSSIFYKIEIHVKIDFIRKKELYS